MSTTNRPSRFFWFLGVVVLIVSAAGTAWIIKNPPSTQAPGGGDGAALAHEVVCFGHVDVEHGVVSLYPTQPGRVQEVKVAEGQSVKKGAVLVQLDDSLAKLLRDQAQADRDAAAAQEREVTNLTKQKEYKIAQQNAAIKAMESRLAAAEKAWQRKEELFKANQLNRTEVDAAHDLVREANSLLEAEKDKLSELNLLNPEAGIARAKADVAAKDARLKQAELSIKECKLLAPQDGLVLRVLIGKGDVLGTQPKQPAILFCPDEERIIRAEVEQEFASRVKEKTVATIQDDTTTSDKWYGKVERISDWYTHRRSILQEPFQFNDVRTLECIIRLDKPTAEQKPLRIGQRVRVLIGRGP
jgi:multidrug resistance efflux pump